MISKELIANELALILKLEGHEVKVFIDEIGLRNCCEGIVEVIPDDWQGELDWVGKDGLIVFDDVGSGRVQDNLRHDGYRVIGGSEFGDRLETDRAYGQEIFARFGLKKIPSFNFESVEDAIAYVRSVPGERWVVKLNGSQHASTSNYVGELPEGNDVINMLERYRGSGHIVHLQKRITGVEIGIGRYFNGKDWVGPIELNVEHKSLMPNGVGPKTPEMGTLMWYDSDEENPLFQETLFRLREHLAEIGFRGDFDINCIVNDEGVWPLEATARFGNPSTALQLEIHLSPWGEFLGAIADGQSYQLDYKRGYGIVVTIAIPPFPYEYLSLEHMSQDTEIFFRNPVSEEEIARHYFFEEVAKISGNDPSDSRYVVRGHKGCVAHVTGFGETIAEARINAYARVQNLVVPKMFYREDIGVNFMRRDEQLLIEWGWLKCSKNSCDTPDLPM